MELTTGNVDMHFSNVTIEVNSAGHDIFKRVSNTRPDSPPPASRQPQDAIRTDAASFEPLEAHDQGDEPWSAGTATQPPTRAPGTLTSSTHDLPEDWDSYERLSEDSLETKARQT